MFKLTIVIIGIILTLLALYIAVIVSLILFDSNVAGKGFTEEINPMPFQHNQPPMPFQHNLMPLTPKDKDWKGKGLWYEKEKGDRRPSIELTVEDFDKLISELKLEQKMLTNQSEIEISRFELEIEHLSKQKDKLK